MELIGKKVLITAKDSSRYDECGIVKSFDGYCYYVTMDNMANIVFHFYRNEFKVIRELNQ